MNSISKAVLLSAVDLCVNSGNFAYASLKIPDSILKFGTYTQHTHHTYIRHTLQKLDLSSPLFDDRKNRGTKLASVCFITDAGNCSGNEFGDLGSPENNDHGDPGDLCEDAGYTNEPCPEGSTPSDFCPYDDSYHGSCGCSSEFDKVCDPALGEVGVGESCSGKYKECCNICEGYDYTSIPDGYVSAGVCDSCDGKKYKVKCDPVKYPSLNDKCGAQGGGGNSCTDDEGTHYQECNCPLNYEWNEAQQKCVCSTSFRYSCQGSGYTGGSGAECDGKYTRCECEEGYVWNEAQGACICENVDWCSISQDCTSLGYAQQSCNGQILKCPFDTSYIYCLESDDGETTEPDDGQCTYGDIYYSDKTCSKEYDSSKTPIGVVVYDENNEKWIMALNSVSATVWTMEYYDVPQITNYNSAETVINDLKSCENTDAMIERYNDTAGGSEQYIAAREARSYVPQGAPETRGKWCLAAAGLWKALDNNRAIIEEGFSKAQGENVEGFPTRWYWTSSEMDGTYAWRWSRSAKFNYAQKTNYTERSIIRPVMKIQ